MARRRKRGTGSIRRRKDGLYIAQVSLGTRPDGKRDRRSFNSRNRGDIDFWLRATFRAHARGDERAANTLTVEDYLSDWFDAVTPTVRPTTARRYAIHIRKWIVPVIGWEPLTDLDPAEVRRVLALMTKAGRSPRTAHSVLVTLRMALTAAVRDGRLERNVAEGVKPPRSTRTTVIATKPDEARRILAASDTSLRGSIDRPAASRASQPAIAVREAASETGAESTGRAEMVQAFGPVTTGGASSPVLARRVAPAATRVIVMATSIAAVALGSGDLLKTAGLFGGFMMLALLAYRQLQWPEPC